MGPAPTNTEKQVRELRVECDELKAKIKALSPSREISIAVTKLQEVKHWLGEELANCGAELPKPYQDKEILKELA